MASNETSEGQEGSELSSDDECLATIKRKAENGNNRDCINLRTGSDVEEQSLIASAYVKVEVEVLSGDDSEYMEKPKKPRVPKKKAQPDICKNWKPPPKKKRIVTCLECGENFKTSGELREHSIEHQTETRHKCDICGRCFNKAFGLRTHKRMHNEKKFKCTVCNKLFRLEINLGRHMRLHHKGNPNKCSHCRAEFYSKKKLLDHMNCYHFEEMEKVRLKQSINTLDDRPPIKFKIKLPKLNEGNPSISRKTDNETESEDDSNNTTNENNGTNTSNENNVTDNSDPSESYIKKREEVIYATQCAIVSKMHKGRSVTDICEIYKLTPEVVNQIWEDREEFDILKKAGRKSNKYMNGVLDAMILEWFQEKKANDVQVTGKMLMDIAEAFAKQNGFVAFNGSKKWLDRFKQRYRITFRPPPSKQREYNNNPMESKWKRQFLEEQWLDAKNGITDDDIYTADEVGVFFNPSNGRIRKLGGKKYIHGFPKDRLAVFMCANFTGRDKKRLLVCGTDDPLIHSFRSPDTLPVTYIRHAQGHFTTSMFEEYVKFWNRELQYQNRKAVLILDRATIHSKLMLSNLKLVFVPWKATNSLMPIKNGIFNRFRDEYRKLILEEKAMNVLRGIDRNLTCLEALTVLEKAWHRTPRDFITKCFEGTGYTLTHPCEHDELDIPKLTDNDDEFLCKLLEEFDVDSYYHTISSMDNYITVDDEFLTGHGTNGSVFGGNHKVPDSALQKKEFEDILPLATDRPESDDVENTIVKSRVLQDLEIVRKYLQSNDTTYDVFCNFMEVEKFLLKNTSS